MKYIMLLSLSMKGVKPRRRKLQTSGNLDELTASLENHRFCYAIQFNIA